MRDAVIGAALALVPLLPSLVSAQECRSVDFEGSAPLDGATGIPTDALLHGRYGFRAVYSGEPVILEGPEGTVMPPVVFDGAEGSLIVTPEIMVPFSTYTVRWPSLFDDEDRAGAAGVTTFQTGAGPDGGPPVLDDFVIEGWDAVGDHDPCTDSRQDRWVFRLDVTGLDDDSGAGGVEVLVLQTRRPDFPDETEPDVIAVRGVREGDERLSVKLARGRGLGRVCFAGIARDLVGNVSPATEPTCTTTRAPPFFDGCSAAPPRRGGGARVLAGLVALAAWLRLSPGRKARRRWRAPGRRA